jgi:hypothetical protein
LPLHPSFAKSWPALRLAATDAIERAI